MKALSIIGIVLSVIGVALTSMANSESNVSLAGMLILIIMLFFLAFSITATAVSFRKKKQ